MSLEERLFKSFDDQQKVEHEAREIETLINSFDGSSGLLPKRPYGQPVDPSKIALTIASSSFFLYTLGQAPIFKNILVSAFSCSG